jgi:hypothetical protein
MGKAEPSSIAISLHPCHQFLGDGLIRKLLRARSPSDVSEARINRRMLMSVMLWRAFDTST